MERTRSPGKDRGPELYIGNLPYDVTEDEIMFLLKDFDPLRAKKVTRDLKCFAFVQMSTEENACQALAELNRTVLRGRTLVLRIFSLEINPKNSGHAQQVMPPTWTPAAGSEGPHDTDGSGNDQIFISNLPCDVCKDDLCELFKDFKLAKIKVFNRENYSFAFVTLRSAEDARMAISKTHGMMYEGRRVSCKAHNPKHDGKDSSLSEDTGDVTVSAVKSDPRDGDVPRSPSGKEENEIYMDDHQKDVAKDKFILRPGGRRAVSAHQEPDVAIRRGSVGADDDTCDDAVRAGEPRNGAVYTGTHVNQSSVTSSPGLSERAASPPHMRIPGSSVDPEDSQTGSVCSSVKVTAARNPLLIPVEMRGPFLADMLKGCFGDLSWLRDLADTSGELSLLVTSTYPDTDYFWAALLSQETYFTLSNICMSLVQAEPQLPRLMKGDVQRGARCMARCALIEGEQGTWSRCWVADVAAGLAVVFFVDYGVTNVVVVSALRPLDDDQYWSVPPLAMPFLLLEGRDIDGLVGTVFKGRVCGPCSRQVIVSSMVVVYITPLGPSTLLSFHPKYSTAEGIQPAPFTLWKILQWKLKIQDPP